MQCKLLQQFVFWYEIHKNACSNAFSSRVYAKSSSWAIATARNCKKSHHCPVWGEHLHQPASQPASQPRQSTSHQPNSRPVVPAPFLCSFFVCVYLMIYHLWRLVFLAFQTMRRCRFNLRQLKVFSASFRHKPNRYDDRLSDLYTHIENYRHLQRKGEWWRRGVERQKANVRIPARLTCCNTLQFIFPQKLIQFFDSIFVTCYKYFEYPVWLLTDRSIFQYY